LATLTNEKGRGREKWESMKQRIHPHTTTNLLGNKAER
jgi:hypothetical protein